MFAQAISSTMPATASSRIIGGRSSRCAPLCPRRPSFTVIAFALNRPIVWAVIPF